MIPKWIPKPIRWLINRLDDPFDNLKHYLYGYHRIFGMCFKVRVPMANKKEWRFRIEKVKPDECNKRQGR